MTRPPGRPKKKHRHVRVVVSAHPAVNAGIREIAPKLGYDVPSHYYNIAVAEKLARDDPEQWEEIRRRYSEV